MRTNRGPRLVQTGARFSIRVRATAPKSKPIAPASACDSFRWESIGISFFFQQRFIDLSRLTLLISSNQLHHSTRRFAKHLGEFVWAFASVRTDRATLVRSMPVLGECPPRPGVAGDHFVECRRNWRNRSSLCERVQRPWPRTVADAIARQDPWAIGFCFS